MGLATAATIMKALGTLLATRIGQIALAAGLAFYGGYALKARLDGAATQRAIIAKQKIDLAAAESAASDSRAVIARLSAKDIEQQEIIRDLNGNCTLDDAAARGLRRLR
jgi:hypothetical protein